MEITLFCYLSLWGIVLHLRERAEPSRLPSSLAILAVATLARPEGLLLLVLAAVDRFTRFKATDSGLGLALAAPRSIWLTGLPVALLLLPTGIFYRLAGGSVLPTTFAVKGSSSFDPVPSGRHLSTVLDIVFRSQPVMLLFAGAGMLILMSRLGGRRDRGLLPALWPLALALAYSVLASPTRPVLVGNFGRYYFPILPLVVVLGVLGLQQAGRHLGAVRFAGRRLPLRALGTAALIAPQLWGLGTGLAYQPNAANRPRSTYLLTLANVEESDVAAGRWLADRLPSEAVLAVQDIGAIRYHLPNRIVDLTGIVNPEILPYLKGSGPRDPIYWEQRLLAFLGQEKPDYLVVFPRSYPQLTGPGSGFEKIRSFPVRDNVTMAGDELAIFSTPWTRYPLRQEAAGR